MNFVRYYGVPCILTVTLFSGVFSGWAQDNMLSNPGFETGTNNQRVSDGIYSWTVESQPTWNWGRIKSSATTTAHSGTNQFQLDACGNYNKVLSQKFKATTGVVYEVDAWMKSLAGSTYFKPTNGFCSVKLMFLNSAGTEIGAEESVIKFRKNGPTNWTQYTTGPVMAPSGTVTGKAMLVYSPGGEDWSTNGDQTTSGYVYCDDFRALTNTSYDTGALKNAGFEVRNGTTYLPLTNLPYWTGNGISGGGVTNAAHCGNFALQIWDTETLVSQRWSATGGVKYANSVYMMKNRLDSTNVAGVLLLRYLNASGGLIQLYESARHTYTNADNVWVQYEATGVAPSGTVYGETMFGIIGSAANYGTSSIYFDDATQRVVSTGTTTNGLLLNPGFDDGPTGNAYNLYESGDFREWEWLGGTNAGFVVNTRAQAGSQSLVIVYPNNLAGQTFVAQTGMSYIVDGYVYTPTAGGITDTTAYATLLLEFFNPDGAAQTTSVSVASAPQITSASTKGVWHHLCVTNRAPWSGPVTGRVLCAFLDLDGDLAVGEVYFDNLTVTPTNIAVDANTQSGALWNPGFEYTAPGTRLSYIDDWYGLGYDGNIDTSFQRSGHNALKLFYTETLAAQSWTPVPGYKYETSGWVSSSPSEPFISSTNAKAMILLQYLDAFSNVLITYESDWYTGSSTPGVWSNLTARGVAPRTAVKARTLCALLGNDDAFSGGVWFDDLTQALVSTGQSVSGLLFNPGFEDGIPGNAYDLGNDLPKWTWVGGDNAGFIVDTCAQSGDQSLGLTWPDNYLVQDFTATPGESYRFSGYLFTPSSAKFTTDGRSYGHLAFYFYVNGSTNADEGSVAYSAPFTGSATADTWQYFCVTGKAPSGVSVKGCAACTIYSSNADKDSKLGGVIFFDSLSLVIPGSTPVSDFALWQLHYFGTTNGTNVSATGDYDGDQVCNENEYAAGTDPTSATSYLSMESIGMPGSGASVILRWNSVTGRTYRIVGRTNLSAGSGSILVSNIPATAPINTYTTAPFPGLSCGFYHVEINTNGF